MNITRRDALRGATAAVVVTGAIAAPLAIKVALAGDPVIELAAQVKAAYRASVEADDAYEAAADEERYFCRPLTIALGQMTWWPPDSATPKGLPLGSLQKSPPFAKAYLPNWV